MSSRPATRRRPTSSVKGERASSLHPTATKKVEGVTDFVPPNGSLQRGGDGKRRGSGPGSGELGRPRQPSRFGSQRSRRISRKGNRRHWVLRQDDDEVLGLAPSPRPRFGRGARDRGQREQSRGGSADAARDPCGHQPLRAGARNGQAWRDRYASGLVLAGRPGGH